VYTDGGTQGTTPDTARAESGTFYDGKTPSFLKVRGARLIIR
jgi:hypothetical protein